MTRFEIMRSTMVDHFVKLQVKVANANIELSENGGFFLVSRDWTSRGVQVFADETLRHKIMVYRSNGDVHSRIGLSGQNLGRKVKFTTKSAEEAANRGNIIGAKFIKNEKIFILYDSGKYLIFCPVKSDVIHGSELTPKGFFRKDTGNLIVGMTTFENSAIFWTENGGLHLIQNVYVNKRNKLMDDVYCTSNEDNYIEMLRASENNRVTVSEPRHHMDLAHFRDDLQVQVFADPKYPNSKKRFFMFPHSLRGLWLLMWNGQSVSKKRLFERIETPIHTVSLSYRTRTLAFLTRDLKLEVHEIKDIWRKSFGAQHTYQFSNERVDLGRLRGLKWIKDYVLCFCYIDRVHFLTLGADKYPMKHVKTEAPEGTDRLFYCTEVDGLRVLFNSTEETENYLYRVRSKAIMETENVSSLHEASYLYQWYQNVHGKEGLKSEEKDLRSDQPALMSGISMILKALQFKENHQQMAQMLRASAFGKLYIAKDEDIKMYADKIFEMAKLIKVEYFYIVRLY